MSERVMTERDVGGSGVKGGCREIGVGALREVMAEGGCRVVDVREPVEYADERIPGAELVPLGEVERRAGEFGAGERLVVVCQSGKRGEAAVKKLRGMGFERVENLRGGLSAWKAAGGEVEGDGRGGLPLMRQVQLVVGVMVLGSSLLALGVDGRFAWVAAFFGAGLTMAGATGWCGMAMLMAKMPWNAVGKS